MTAFFVPALQNELDDPWPSEISRSRKAASDLVSGFAKSWIWGNLALQDIVMRYRGSIIGPFWLTLSTVVLAGSMGIIYPRLFHVTAVNYVPYLFISMIVWQLVSGFILDACTCLTSQAGVIQQIPLPFSVHAYRSVARGLLTFAHTAIVIPVVLLIYGIPVSWRIVEIVPALMVLSIGGVAICLIFGPISSRFRDLPPIITSFLQVVFFVTPIFWPISALGDWQNIAALNPLFAAVDIIRAPLTNQTPFPSSWFVIVGSVAILCLLSFAFFARFRERFAYWV